MVVPAQLRGPSGWGSRVRRPGVCILQVSGQVIPPVVTAVGPHGPGSLCISCFLSTRPVGKDRLKVPFHPKSPCGLIHTVASRPPHRPSGTLKEMT